MDRKIIRTLGSLPESNIGLGFLAGGVALAWEAFAKARGAGGLGDPLRHDVAETLGITPSEIRIERRSRFRCSDVTLRADTVMDVGLRRQGLVIRTPKRRHMVGDGLAGSELAFIRDAVGWTRR